MNDTVCIHGVSPCTCNMNDEFICECKACFIKVLDQMVLAGLLNINENGTYSLSEAERNKNEDDDDAS